MKYAAYLTEDEAGEFAKIEAEKALLQAQLRSLRAPYMKIFTRCRDRARAASNEGKKE